MLSDVEHDLDLRHQRRQVLAIHRRVRHLDGHRFDVNFSDPNCLGFELKRNGVEEIPNYS
jgi:hypothetical protein